MSQIKGCNLESCKQAEMACKNCECFYYLPYFVVYRISYLDGSQPLFLEYFLTLSELFDYIRLNKDSWVYYSVGRTLEIFNNPDGSFIDEVHSYRL